MGKLINKFLFSLTTQSFAYACVHVNFTFKGVNAFKADC